MKKLILWILLLPIIANAQRTLLVNTNDGTFSNTNTLSSNILAGAGISIVKGAKGQLTLSTPGGSTIIIQTNSTAISTQAVVNFIQGSNIAIKGTNNAGAAKFDIEINSTGAGDSDAIHDNVAGEISAVTSKATPIAADFAIIEDSAAGNAKKSITLGSLESLLEGVMDLQEMQGAVTDAQVPNTITIDLATVATTANAGDSATAFFSSGEIEDARLPAAITRDTEWDTEAEVQTAWGSVNILLETEIDASSELRALMDDEVGAGNLMFTRVGVVREVWIGAGAITPATTNGAALGTNTVGADDLTLDVLDFDDTTTEYGWFQWSPPDSWDHGTVKAKFIWTTVSGTGGVVWGIAGGAVADDGTLNGSILGTAVTVADTRLADHDLHLTSATAAVTVGGTPTLAKPVFWRVHRLPSDGSDTKTGDARLMGIKIQYTETTTEPSAW